MAGARGVLVADAADGDYVVGPVYSDASLEKLRTQIKDAGGNVMGTVRVMSMANWLDRGAASDAQASHDHSPPPRPAP